MTIKQLPYTSPRAGVYVWGDATLELNRCGASLLPSYTIEIDGVYAQFEPDGTFMHFVDDDDCMSCSCFIEASERFWGNSDFMDAALDDLEKNKI